MIRHRSAFVFFLVLAFPAFADSQITQVPDTIIVTADRLSSPESRVASSVTVITRAEIERKQAATVAELLRDVPGLHVSSSGGAGQLTSVFLRGAESSQTLVLVDGVKANDPVHTSRGFNFAHLQAENIERIEIIRGPQSVLYGSDAIGGVINLITRKGTGRMRAEVEGEYGAYQSYAARGSVAGGERSYHYSLSGEFLETSGFSAANEAFGNAETDGRSSRTIGTRIGGEVAGRLKLDVNARYAYARSDMDRGGGAGKDDPNYFGEDKTLQAGIQASPLGTQLWEPVLNVSYFLQKRSTSNAVDSSSSATESTSFDGNRLKGDFQNNFYVDERHTVTVALEVEKEWGSFSEDYGSGTTAAADKSASTVSVLSQDKLTASAFFSTFGARLDHHDRFGSKWTWRVAPGVKIPGTETTFKGTLGTGFKSPSLYQLYSTSGNASLLPERSIGFDVGVQQGLAAGDAAITATYFQSKLEDLIDYDFSSSKYLNINRVTTRGFELGGWLRPIDSIRASASHTYTFARNEGTGVLLPRRPRHSLSGDIRYDVKESTQLSLSWRYVGSRLDSAFTGKEMPGYTVFGLTGSHSIMPDLRVFGRIENLLDREYEEVDGYGTAGRSLYVGLRKEI